MQVVVQTTPEIPLAEWIQEQSTVTVTDLVNPPISITVAGRWFISSLGRQPIPSGTNRYNSTAACYRSGNSSASNCGVDSRTNVETDHRGDSKGAN